MIDMYFGQVVGSEEIMRAWAGAAAGSGAGIAAAAVG